MACAQTGSRKTAAFWFPIISGIMRGQFPRHPRSLMAFPLALILSSTRELSCQTNAEANSAAPVDPPEVEEKHGVVPNDLWTDSDVAKREAESMSSNKDIFLTKLISNASDGLDKISSLALTDKEVLGEGDNTKLDIQIKLDEEKKILSIHDRGVGMTMEDLRKSLGTIAKSGTLRDF
ncbi:Endoplasmin -like protein [Capsicum chinense]|nr:Endoplasmin -like protein [Capsicum chinense]